MDPLEMLGQFRPLVGGEITKVAAQLPGGRLGRVVLGHVPSQGVLGEAAVGARVAHVLEELERNQSPTCLSLLKK